MTTRTYSPGDPTSSPYEPAMGDIVIYRTFRGGRTAPECYPAIIVKTYEKDRCDLTVFSSTGVRYATMVKFSTDVESENSWSWPQERIARTPVAPTGATEKAIDKQSEVVQTA